MDLRRALCLFPQISAPPPGPAEPCDSSSPGRHQQHHWQQQRRRWRHTDNNGSFGAVAGSGVCVDPAHRCACGQCLEPNRRSSSTTVVRGRGSGSSCTAVFANSSSSRCFLQTQPARLRLPCNACCPSCVLSAAAVPGLALIVGRRTPCSKPTMTRGCRGCRFISRFLIPTGFGAPRVVSS